MAQKTAKLIKYIEEEEFKKVLKAEKDRRFKLAYALAFGSGLRISEIVGPAPNSNQEIKSLTKEQIDLKAHTIKILGKGGKERITVTSPWLNETNIQLLPLKIARRTLQNRFTKLSKKILHKDLSFHTLRHGWANLLANERNLPIAQLQQLGGWSRLDTVGIYTKANPKRAIEAAWERF